MSASGAEGVEPGPRQMITIGQLADYAGVVQRCCLIISYAWIFTISLKMNRS